MIFFLRYPDGVDVEEGERWYVSTHAREAREQQGLCRYVSWKGLAAPQAVPGRSLEELNKWVRVTEVCYVDWDAWRDAAARNPLTYTPAPWADPAKVQKGASASYVGEIIFIGDKPEYDLLREVPDVTEGETSHV
jgi:hypothetical protein